LPHPANSEPFGAKLLSVPSPAFAAKYPAIQHKELISSKLAAFLETIWTIGEFPARSIDFYRLRKVFVGFEGLVFDRELNVHPASVAGHAPDEIATARRQIGERMADGSLPVHLRPSVLCKKRGTHNYGHFLVEMLSKAFLAKRHLRTQDLHYVVGAEAGALGAVMRDALSMIEIEERQTIRCDRQPAFFSELILIDGLTEHGRFVSPLVFDCLERLAAMVPADGNDRIYVSRASAKFRKLSNEDELVPLLQDQGYAIVDPGLLSLRRQIAMFKSARSIIGVTGAALTNIVFSYPGASVTCLTPATMPETFFWFLSTLKDHRFLDVRLAEAGGEPPGFPSWAGNIRIEPDALRRLISV
jgi:capsular polysaccharide biosynthesis protein